MPLLLAILLLGLTPAAAQDAGGEQMFDMRTRENLLFGTGTSSGRDYYDVVITRQPDDGVVIKLPYTQRGGRLTFDLHHRLGLGEDFGLPAEIMTVVEVVTGGMNRLGTYTLLQTFDESPRYDEEIQRVSAAAVDRYVTPLGRRTITIDTRPGPQSISIVGRDLTITRDGATMRIDAPGTRIAMVSNVQFEETRPGQPLGAEPED